MIARAEAERALRDSEERRWHEARHDPLTGLPNRLGLTEGWPARSTGPRRRTGSGLPARPGPVPRAQRHARAGRGRPAAGHGRGAAVRARRRPAAGPARRRRVRVLVPDGGDLVAAATTLLDALAGAPLQVGPTPLTVTASAGLTERRVAGLDVDELLRSADIALTWAKSDGRNRWRRFDPDRNAADTARWSLAAELPAAVRDGGLEVHYQPMVGLADGRLRAVEALVRWHHPRQGLLLPGRFIAAAEETGLIVPLGRQVLAAACAEAAAWDRLTTIRR